MKAKAFLSVVLLVVLALALSGSVTAQVEAGQGRSATGSDPAAPAPGSSPVMFIENVGQFPEGVRFRVYGGDRSLWLAGDALWVTVLQTPPQPSPTSGRELHPSLRPPDGELGERGEVRGVHLRLTFPGANPHPRLEPFGRLETSVNYFLGNDPKKWRTHVPVWSGVRYVDLYPGVDLEVTGEAGRWSWRLVTRTPTLALPLLGGGNEGGGVRLRVEGADEVELLPSPAGGEGLLLRTAVGEYTLPLLRVERANVERGNVERINAQTFEVTSPFSPAPWLPGPSAQTAGASDLAYATFLGGEAARTGAMTLRWTGAGRPT